MSQKDAIAWRRCLTEILLFDQLFWVCHLYHHCLLSPTPPPGPPPHHFHHHLCCHSHYQMLNVKLTGSCQKNKELKFVGMETSFTWTIWTTEAKHSFIWPLTPFSLSSRVPVFIHEIGSQVAWFFFSQWSCFKNPSLREGEANKVLGLFRIRFSKKFRKTG